MARDSHVTVCIPKKLIVVCRLSGFDGLSPAPFRPFLPRIKRNVCKSANQAQIFLVTSPCPIGFFIVTSQPLKYRAKVTDIRNPISPEKNRHAKRFESRNRTVGATHAPKRHLRGRTDGDRDAGLHHALQEGRRGVPHSPHDVRARAGVQQQGQRGTVLARAGGALQSPAGRGARDGKALL